MLRLIKQAEEGAMNANEPSPTPYLDVSRGAENGDCCLVLVA